MASLASLCLLPLLAGCTLYLSFGEGKGNIFPQIRDRDRQVVRTLEGGVRLEVFYAEGEERFLAEVLDEARKTVQFLRQMIQTPPKALVRFYLYPVGPDREIPSHAVRGSADYIEVLFYREGEPLLAIDDNREKMRSMFPHELAHAFLSSFNLKDRWLSDGLPEYVAGEFARIHDGEFSRGRHWWHPPEVALHRATFKAWSRSDFRRMMLKRLTDRDYAEVIGEEMLWKYSAAEELTRRWMGAARENGIAEPFQDLLRRVKAFSRPIDWKVTRELCLAQTGRAIEEIGKVTEEEVRMARREAWEARASLNLAERTRALRTLTFFGLPEGASAHDLLGSFEIPLEREKEWGPTVWTAAGAVAAGDDPRAALNVVELLRAKRGEDYLYSAVPELWVVISKTDRNLAIESLLTIISKREFGLPLRDRANEALKKITGKDAGWSIEAGKRDREKAAARWKTLLKGSEVRAQPSRSARDLPLSHEIRAENN